MTMASAAMQQQHQQEQQQHQHQQLYQSLDPSHQPLASPNHRHHLSVGSSTALAPNSHYYPPHHPHPHHQHHQQQQQLHNHSQYQAGHYNSIYQENLAPRAIFGGTANQMEDRHNHSQTQSQQIQHNNENSYELFNQTNEAHFYYQQAANSIGNQEVIINHNNHHHHHHPYHHQQQQQSNYHDQSRAAYSAAVAAVAVPIVGYTASNNHLYNDSTDHHYNNSSTLTTSSGATPTSTPSSGTSSNQYQSLYNQSNLVLRDSSKMQQSHQSLTNNQRQNEQLHYQQQHQLRINASAADQGRSLEISGLQNIIRNKIEDNSTTTTDESTKTQEDIESNSKAIGETVLTELSPKLLQSKNAFVNNQKTAQEQFNAVLRNSHEIEELDSFHDQTTSSKKRKRLAKVSSNNNSNYQQTIKNELHMQLGSAYESRNELQNEKKNDDYFEGERRRIVTRKVDHSLADSSALLSAALSIQTNQASSSELDAHCDQLDKYRTFPLAESEQLAKSQNNQHLLLQQRQQTSHLNHYKVAPYQAAVVEVNQTNELQLSPEKQETDSGSSEFNQLRLIEMRKEKSRDAARSRRSKENHEFYELAKLLPLPAAITSQLDFLDKASIIRLTISFLKLRQFSVNGYPPWAPDFTTLGSVNPYSSQQSLSSFTNHFHSATKQDDPQSRPTSVGNKQAQQDTPISSSSSTSSTSVNQSAFPNTSSNIISNESNIMGLPNECRITIPTPMQSSSVSFNESPYHQPSGCVDKNFIKNSSSLFDIHQGTHILQSIDGFAFAIGRDGRFLYISETVSMYLGLSQVEMTGSSVFDYAHQQDHEELAKQLGIPYTSRECNQETNLVNNCESPQPASVHSQYSAASNETLIDDHINSNCPRKRTKIQPTTSTRGAYGRSGKRAGSIKHPIKVEASNSDTVGNLSKNHNADNRDQTQLKNQLKDISDGSKTTELQGTAEDPLVRQFCIRMKSTLTKRGCQHFKSSGYRVVHVVAHLRSYQSNDHGHLMDPLDEATVPSSSTKQTKRRAAKTSNKDSSSINKELNKESSDNITSDGTILDTSNHESVTKPKIIGMVAVAIALPPPSINELRLESGTFVLRLSLDLRITHIEPKVTELLNYPVELVAGRSLYSIIHPADVYQVQRCHKDLLKKGQMMSGYYRLLARNGGYIWIQTCGTLICNNTFGNQAPVLSNSPMPTPNSVTGQHEFHHKLPNSYLAPTSINTSDQLTTSGISIGSHSKVMSPGLSSHMSSNNDNQEQDQCVIFVNYMITNIVENNEIIDICQSSDYTPTSSFSGNTNNNIIFNSSSPSRSSPCLSSKMKTNSIGQFNSSSTPNNNTNLSSPSRRHHNHSNNHHHHNNNHHQHHHQLQHQHEESKRVDLKGMTNERRLNSLNNSKVKQQIYSSASSNSNENHDHGIHNMSTLNNNFSINQIGVNKVDNLGDHERVLESASAANMTNSTSAVYGYPQTPGSVNLALNKPVHGTETSSWLSHHPSTASRLGDTSIVYGTNQAAAAAVATNHYETMNRSIYKAAFGLADVSGTNYNHQQSAAVAAAAVYPTAAAAAAVATNANTSYPAGVTNSSWDSAAVAAVAAASNHLTNNHHHHNAHNPYAHLESHNHNHQAAHGLGSNHHTSAAGTYYNYYGYYGNKFI